MRSLHTPYASVLPLRCLCVSSALPLRCLRSVLPQSCLYAFPYKCELELPYHSDEPRHFRMALWVGRTVRIHQGPIQRSAR